MLVFILFVFSFFLLFKYLGLFDSFASEAFAEASQRPLQARTHWGVCSKWTAGDEGWPRELCVQETCALGTGPLSLFRDSRASLGHRSSYKSLTARFLSLSYKTAVIHFKILLSRPMIFVSMFKVSPRCHQLLHSVIGPFYENGGLLAFY